ncbi:hypothetical protein Pcinc_029525 [Petrolisthes cinctipes]|uniref:Peptidase S1 domain-containing protein n=1 Tax=Petrolisthes cinctipes TaxID=88211 RepID=A0AAE1EZW0_PETCI|nr:hypothetical protein Pcinc_029525 [Petrolisthes cinctipes]
MRIVVVVSVVVVAAVCGQDTNPILLGQQSGQHNGFTSHLHPVQSFASQGFEVGNGNSFGPQTFVRDNLQQAYQVIQQQVSNPGQFGGQQQQQQAPNQASLARANVAVNAHDKAYQECQTPRKEAGHCRHLLHCKLPELSSSYQVFLQYACIIDNVYIGVCCPSSRRSQSQQESQLRPILLPGESPKPEPEPEPEPLPLPQPQPKPTRPPQPQPRPTTPPQPQKQQQQKPNHLSSLQKKLTGDTACGVVSDRIHTRIVGGFLTNPGEYPWIVSILRREAIPNQYCGGALISSFHVLTAAHCIASFNQNDIWVRVGEHNFNRTDESLHVNHRVSRFLVHPEFQNRNFNNDIALLTLAQPVRYGQYVRPICLPQEEELLENKMATVAGWGAVQYNGPISAILRQVHLPVWSNTNCDQAYRQPIMDSMVCAGFPAGGKDACQDDSGGPLMIQGESGKGPWQVVGLVSFGTRCAEPGIPGVYTRVTSFLRWVAENV